MKEIAFASLIRLAIFLAINRIYIRTLSSKYLLSALLNWFIPVYWSFGHSNMYVMYTGPQRIYKPYYDYQNFFSLANGVYLREHPLITFDIRVGRGGPR